MKSYANIPYAIVAALCAALLCAACNHQTEKTAKADNTETTSHEELLMETLENDAKLTIEMADSLQEIGKLTEAKANYYKAQAFYRLGQDLTAELCYKHALATEELYEERPLTYYFACDQLSTILTCKGDEQASLDIATKGYALARKDATPQGRQWAALLLHDIGYCQMRLEHNEQAEKNFAQAYTTLKELANQDSKYDFLYAWARVSYNILDAYTSTGHFDKAAQWIDSVEVVINKMAASEECSPQKAEEYMGSFYTHKASILTKTGHQAEADKVYEKFLQLNYANTNIGLVDNAEYLEMAERWNDRANLTPRIDSLLKAWDTPLSMYWLRAYLIPNFNAYLKSGRREEALNTAQMIAEKMDSIEDYERRHNAAELSIIYETQEKERQIAEQQAQLRNQKMIALTAASLTLIIFLAVFIYFRHRTALKLEEKNRELERKNAELTVANARAEESSRMKTNFIRQISHEIRTPLNILSGFTQIVTATEINLTEDEQRHARDQILENTNRITGLVNKMLELSEAGSQVIIEKNDDVTAIQIAVQAIEETGIGNCPHIDFHLTIAPETGDIMLHTNLKQASRALSLLLDNAMKFLRKPNGDSQAEGAVTLTVSGTSPVSFTVEDNGIGIPAAEAENIFKEFIQLNEYYDGTGIGLTVARSIARRLEGDITLDTSYTKGARFVMTLA